VKSRSRLQEALQLRDAALAALKARGEMSAVYGVPGRVLTADLGDLSILHSTPFQKLHLPTPDLAFKAALFEQETGKKATLNLPYGLDIWSAGRKVFNLEWSDDDHEVKLVTFKRGAWEASLLTGSWRSTEMG